MFWYWVLTLYKCFCSFFLPSGFRASLLWMLSSFLIKELELERRKADALSQGQVLSNIKSESVDITGLGCSNNKTLRCVVIIFVKIPLGWVWLKTRLTSGLDETLQYKLHWYRKFHNHVILKIYYKTLMNFVYSQTTCKLTF